MADNAQPAAQDTTPAAQPAAPAPEAKPAEQQKPAEEPKAAAAPEAKTETKAPEQEKKVVPEKYDLKLPENSVLDSDALERIAAHAKAQGLSNEEAQALVEADHASLSEYVTQKSNKWMEMSKADKEIGGDHFNQNVELAKRVIAKFGSDSLKSELNKTGFGNHPELVRIFSRIGRLMSEDQLVIPGAQAGGAKRSMEEMFYGNSQHKEN